MTALEDQACREHARRKQRLPRLLQLIKKTIQKDGRLNSSPCWSEAVKEMEYEIAVSNEIVGIRERARQQYFDVSGLDFNIKKPPQRHRAWAESTKFLAEIVNEFYHTEACERECKVSHEKTYRKVAELLKIAYPSIWKEDLPTIANRIKQKDYRRS